MQEANHPSEEKMESPQNHHRHEVVVLFYKYFLPPVSLLLQFPEYYAEKLYQHQLDLCQSLKLRGRVLLSVKEGINGSLSAENETLLKEYMTKMQDFDLVRDCGLPDGVNETDIAGKEGRLYSNIDWKQSTVDKNLGVQEPFPDLKLVLVNEIVSTGGAVTVEEIPQHGGKHLTPQEFHEQLVQNQDNVVLIDVRNTFECDIGHFVQPNGQAAVNPKTTTFSAFDSQFCAKHSCQLQGKKVLMYCTGGIRCEKASAMLRKRGVDDVSQLQGGIHRYLEQYGNDGFFRGKNFVFDQRVTFNPKITTTDQETKLAIVGKCVECSIPFDELDGSRLCTVCRDLVLVCPTCQETLREYHCSKHASWKSFYFSFLEPYSKEELLPQLSRLEDTRNSLIPPAQYKNVRRTLMRQIRKVQDRIDQLDSGQAIVDPDAPKRCRTCLKSINGGCDGNCWGFWNKDREKENSTIPNR